MNNQSITTPNKTALDSADKKHIAQVTIKNIVLVGILSATLTVAKLALFFVANVEIVTLLIMVYATVFGRKTALFSALVFSTVEVLLFGFNTWVVLYFIYWPLLALVAGTILKKPRVWCAVLLAIVLTIVFDVLDSLITTIFAALGGVPTYQLVRIFVSYYIRGIWFYVVHLVSNAVVVGALYLKLVQTLQKVRPN